MSGRNVVLAGDQAASEALEAALDRTGAHATYQRSDGLPEALVAIEQGLEDDRPDAVVAVGAGDAAMALAITAGKLGIPLVISRVDDVAGEDQDKNRILATLASLDAGPDPRRAADLIAAWMAEGPSAANLDLNA